MVAPTLYRSDDASAPVLSYGAGTLIAVLDACLVDGYGAKGAAGWTKDFSGTNKAAYKMGAGGTARRMFLRVDDTAAQFAALRAYDTMSDVDTGLESFPTVQQYAAPGLTTNKSSVASGSAVRPWWLIATPTCFYFSAFTSVTGASAYPGIATTECPSVFFGEYASYIVGFTHHVALIGGTTSAAANTGSHVCTIFSSTAISTIAGHYACRSFDNVQGSKPFNKSALMPAHYGSSSTNPFGRSGGGAWMALPEPVSGKLHGSRCQIHFQGGVDFARVGHLPGLWVPNREAGSMFDTIDGAGLVVGHTLVALDVGGGANVVSGINACGRGFFDMTNFD